MPATGEGSTARTHPAVTDAKPAARKQRPHPGLPVVVVGAGPIGLAAAAHLVERGQRPLVLEAGTMVGASVAQWRHVRLFSPWCYDLDAAAARMLQAAGWTRPAAEALPTGQELLDRYLHPLARLPALAPHIRLGQRVTAIARRGMDKVRTPGREAEPFVVRVQAADGQQSEVQARAVIDASGTWTQPNPLGASGLPALGERAVGDRITGGLPDILGADRDRFAGRRVLVVGAGHSAATSLLALAELQAQVPATQVVWAVRSATPRPLVGKGETDELPARGQLGLDLRRLVDTGRIQLVTGFQTTAVDQADSRLELVGQGPDHAPDQGQRIVADLVINATGFRPDHIVARELRLGLEPALESAAALGPLIDPNVHSCGTVPPHGVRELAHPEPGYYIVGMKSYGRAPTFLLATGYEQVRSVAAALVGDQAAAADVRLALPAGGGCPAHLPGGEQLEAEPCCGGTPVRSEPPAAQATPAGRG
jgi:cation diffusion facilitator CzcD-associated flavoprotein CzcO